MGGNISHDSVPIRKRTSVSSLSNGKTNERMRSTSISLSLFRSSVRKQPIENYCLVRQEKHVRWRAKHEALLFVCLSVFHDVSVFPKKELPFFILFTAGLCSGTAMLALLTHQYPDIAAYIARLFLTWFSVPIQYLTDKIESILPSNLFQQLAKI